MTKPSKGQCEMIRWGRGPYLGRGDWCGQPARYLVDPYWVEVYDQIVRRWLCDECYERRSDNI
jgi:hypothetical protein